MGNPRPQGSLVHRALLIGLKLKRARQSDFMLSMDEMAGLALTAGATLAGRIVQERERIDPAYYFGRGKADEIASLCASEKAELALVNDSLSAAQARNLQERIDCKVVDRTQLILDIFAKRAQTQEGKLQVELAQLSYLLPRLTGKGVELSRLGGGIGTRGPGEMKLEVDRRRIRERIHKIHEAIDKVRMTRSLHRRRRERQGIPTLAIVGYTNAGKSTLFERLTRAHTLCSPALFSTLDPLCRRIRLPGGSLCYVSDTVGFIRKLPVELVAAFRATLEEVVNAHLLLHVCDASSLDLDGDIRAVDKVLADLGAERRPVIKVYNKCDLLPPDLSRRRTEDAVYISALRGDHIDALAMAIEHRLQRTRSMSRPAPAGTDAKAVMQL
ncbi:MAG: GTPase HflX [Acidobacteriota bacterium]